MDIKKLATLARLKLTPEEEGSFANEFQGILAYVDQIQKIKIDDESSSSINETDIINVMRDDVESNPSDLQTEKLLSLSPDREGNYIKVKKIL